jgi:hypothetical protein
MSLQNGRIAADCFKAYRSGGASKTAPLEWTEAMDNELLEAVKKYGTNDWGAGTPPTDLVLMAGPTDLRIL